MARCSQERIFELAEQILLGERALKDLEGLDEDDLQRVGVIVKRGAKALAEEREKHTPLPSHLAKQAARKAQPGRSVFVPTQKRVSFLSQTTGIAFTPLDLSQFQSAPPAVWRQLMDGLTRKLQVDEWACWVGSLSQQEQKQVEAALPGGMWEEIVHRIENLEEEPPVYEREAAWAKVSMIAVQQLPLLEEESEAFTAYLTAYSCQLSEELKGYCKELPVKLGLLRHLREFTNLHWQKLAGFTPRDEMAYMVDFLPQDVVARLMDPLPARQKKEVQEGAFHHRKKREREVRAYGEVMHALKRWAATVDKVLALPGSQEE